MGSPTWTDWFHDIQRVKEMAIAARLIAGMRADELERLNARNLSGINDATLRHAIRQYYLDSEDLLGWIDSGLDRVRNDKRMPYTLAPAPSVAEFKPHFLRGGGLAKGREELVNLRTCCKQIEAAIDEVLSTFDNETDGESSSYSDYSEYSTESESSKTTKTHSTPSE
jgi:hypothetical protein